MKKSKSQTFPAISAISFNGDGSEVAVATKDWEIYIMRTNGSKDTKKWEIVHTLKEVCQMTSSMWWRPQQSSGIPSLVNSWQDPSIEVCSYGRLTLERTSTSQSLWMWMRSCLSSTYPGLIKGIKSSLARLARRCTWLTMIQLTRRSTGTQPTSRESSTQA